jgi:hypothetical protein
LLGFTFGYFILNRKFLHTIFAKLVQHGSKNCDYRCWCGRICCRWIQIESVFIEKKHIFVIMFQRLNYLSMDLITWRCWRVRAGLVAGSTRSLLLIMWLTWGLNGEYDRFFLNKYFPGQVRPWTYLAGPIRKRGIQNFLI